MSTERELAKLAARYSAGDITQTELLSLLGDDNLVSQVLAMTGAEVVTRAAGELVDDVVDTAFDVVESLNPFRW